MYWNGIEGMRICLRDFFSTAFEELEVTFEEPQIKLAQPSPDQQRGLFSRLGADRVGLFSIENRLFVYLNGIASEVDEGMSISYESNGDHRRLHIQIGTSLKTFDYINTRAPASTPFYSEDEEDADFGLWLNNVLNSDERCDSFSKVGGHAEATQ